MLINSPPVHKHLFCLDKFNLLILLGLYLTWGLLFGYFVNSINMLLIKRGANYSSLSQLTIMGYPFALKFIFSPLVDNYYWKWLGKHKTYVLFSNYLISLLLFVSAFYIEEWIKTLDINKITLVGLFIVFPLSFQSIAVDAWPPSLLHPENMRYVGFIANFGQMLGTIFSYNLFIWFNSKTFCNTYIYSTYHETGIISNFWMLIILSILTFVITFLINVFKKEKETPKQEFESFKEFLKTISKFFTNPNIRFFLFALLFSGSGLEPVEAGYVVILKKGFSQTQMSLIDFISSIVSTFAGIFGSYLAKKKKENRCIVILYCINIFFDIFYFFFITHYEEIDSKLAFVIYMIQDIILGANQTIRFVLFISFMLRVCDEKMAAVYTTFFYSVSNFNGLWAVSLSLLLIDYINYTVLCWVGISIATTFLICFGKRIINMDNIEKNLWLITE